MNPPLQLAQILRTHRISLRNVVRKITNQGQTLSATALMRVVNSGHFPTHITEAATRAAIEGALTELA